MRNNVLWLLAGVVLCACIIAAYMLHNSMVAEVDRYRLDAELKQAIASADAQMAAIIEHRPEVVTRVEVIQHETAKRIFALDADDLVVVALARAEAMRSRIAASSDTKGAARLASD